MKKQNRKSIKFIFVYLTMIICFTSCIDKIGVVSVYQLKNSSDSAITLRFYYSFKPTIAFIPDSISLNKNELSQEFTETKGGFDAESFFIFYTDSIDILSKERNLLKRYYHKDLNKMNVGKTMYSTDYFDKDSINSKGQTVHIYSILTTDFYK